MWSYRKRKDPKPQTDRFLWSILTSVFSKLLRSLRPFLVDIQMKACRTVQVIWQSSQFYIWSCIKYACRSIFVLLMKTRNCNCTVRSLWKIQPTQGFRSKQSLFFSFYIGFVKLGELDWKNLKSVKHNWRLLKAFLCLPLTVDSLV